MSTTNETDVTCPKCDGDGYLEEIIIDTKGEYVRTLRLTCDACGGEGVMEEIDAAMYE